MYNANVNFCYLLLVLLQWYYSDQASTVVLFESVDASINADTDTWCDSCNVNMFVCVKLHEWVPCTQIHSTFQFFKTQRQRSKQNTNADVTCNSSFNLHASLFVHHQMVWKLIWLDITRNNHLKFNCNQETSLVWRARPIIDFNSSSIQRQLLELKNWLDCATSNGVKNNLTWIQSKGRKKCVNSWIVKKIILLSVNDH